MPKAVKKRFRLVRRGSLTLNEKAPDLMQWVVFNLGGAKPRYESLEDRQFLVVPMVMLTVGVHNGSQGPLLYEEDQLSKNTDLWNHKPIVIYHPQKGSACDPDVLTNRKVGVILNTKWDGKLKAEAWLEVARLKKIDKDGTILARLEKGIPVEVSTGLFTDNEAAEEGATWNGEKYVAIAKNYRPDHLAILPDQKGACSIEDGAGLLQNEEAENGSVTFNEVSLDAIRDLLRSALQAQSPEDYCYIMEVFASFFIYEKKGKLYQMKYTNTDTKATLVGEPTQVVRVIQYRTEDGTVVANVNKEYDMNPKSEKIQALLATNVWSEQDKPWLEGLEEVRLDQLLKNASYKKGAKDEDEEEMPKKGKMAKNVESAPRQMTDEEFINSAPARVRGMIQNSLRFYEGEKQKLIEALTANADCPFTKEALEKKELDELQALAKLAGIKEAPAPIANYAALADAFGSSPTKNSGTAPKVEPLSMPTL